jgi:hypothetical protein
LYRISEEAWTQAGVKQTFDFVSGFLAKGAGRLLAMDVLESAEAEVAIEITSKEKTQCNYNSQD